ncbi:MAG: efflux RND transporter permease subunit [Chlamydiota bacterium]
MKALITYAVEHKAVTYFLCALLFIGGIASYFSLGQLEDPVFSIKTAVVLTKYPGASPEEVEQEVTDRIEKAIQEMPQLKRLYSVSRPGESYIKVDIKAQYWSDRLPQIWDELRNKVGDVVPQLPPGAKEPMVLDDFGFVYGFLLGLTGEGYSYRELEDYAELIKKEMSLVKGVSRVELWGVQDRVIYVDVTEQQLSQLNLTSETVISTLKNQNMVVDGGALEVENERFRISPSGEFTTPEEIGELILRPHSTDIIDNLVNTAESAPGKADALISTLDDAGNQVIRVKDIGEVYRGYKEPPSTMMRYNGKPSIGIQIAGLEDENIVNVGNRLYDTLENILEKIPVGIEVHKIAWQSDLVEEAVNGFIISLIQAIVIVLIVLIIPSGLKMGLIVGIDLVLTILGTFIVMAVMDIPLQRMSLGALIIALGMMVDNSIVVSDGIAVRFREGMDRKKAAILATSGPAYPLLSATVIAVMAFYPIYASTEDAGEYCRTLFIVVAAALIISWLVAILITPLQCMDMLPEEAASGKRGQAGDEYNKPFFKYFRKILRVLIKFRFLTLLSVGALLMSSLFAFGFVSQMFFPDSSRPQLMIDFWAPEGTRIQSLAKSLEPVEKKLLSDDTVESVSTFIGAGPPRFYLPVDPEKSHQNYAQMIVNFDTFESIDPFIDRYDEWVTKNVPFAMVRTRKYGVGPSNTWKFELRISGPRDASVNKLREIGNEMVAIGKSSPIGQDWRIDMMNRTLKIVPEYDQKRARWSSVSRGDVADATRRGYDGVTAGLYREKDHLYPIIYRNVESERKGLASNLDTLQVRPEQSVNSLPLLQVVNKVDPEWEDPMIVRFNRRRAVSIQGGPIDGVTFPELKNSLIDQIDAIKLPPGYTKFWDGEYDSTVTAKQSLIPGVVPAVVIVLFMLVTVFNAFRPIYVILCTIPFAFIGVTYSLLIFNIPFGFLALLGAMSLAGMMNKNIVVLLDACNDNLAEGMDRYHAIVEASVTRVRPVLLAAGTTVLGVIPLLPDVFWVAMAVTIMGGLAFGSLLTLVLVPVLYSIFYRIEVPEIEEEKS